MGLPRRGWPEAQASPNVSSHDDLPRAPGATKRDTARRTASIPCSHWRLGGTAGRVPTAIAPRRGDVVELELDVAAGPCDCGAWPVFQGVRLTPACCAIWIRVLTVVPPGLNEFHAVSKSLSEVQPSPRLDHSRASSRASGSSRPCIGNGNKPKAICRADHVGGCRSRRGTP